LDLIDGVLPVQFNQYLNAIFSLLGVFASMAFASPYMLIAIAAVFVAYYFFQQFYRTSYVEIQRMEALSRAPIFSQLGETLRGAATIRAYKMEENFRNVNLSVVDMNSTHRFAQKYLLAQVLSTQILSNFF
jgi:ABC-type multidrug transport system fused ATPase/permease subunit